MTVKLVGADDIVPDMGMSKNYLQGTKFIADASGNMTEFKVRSNFSCNMKVALYEDNAGEPGALITAMNTGQAVTDGLNTLTFTSTPITVGVTYWLMVNIDANIGAVKTSTGQQRRYKAAAYSGFSFPNPAGSGFSSQTTYYDIVAGWGTVIAAGFSKGCIIG